VSARRTDDLFKAFSLKPFAASTKTGEVLDLDEVMEGIKNDVTMLTELANWHLDFEILNDFRKLPEKDRKKNSNSLGRKLGVKAPKDVLDGMNSGASRFSEMLCAAVIDAGAKELMLILDCRRNTYLKGGRERLPLRFQRLSTPKCD